MCFHLALTARCQPYLLLEDLRFPGHQGICFADNWDDIDFLVHGPEERHIQGPEPAAGMGQGSAPEYSGFPSLPTPITGPPGLPADPLPKGEMK